MYELKCIFNRLKPNLNTIPKVQHSNNYVCKSTQKYFLTSHAAEWP